MTFVVVGLGLYLAARFVRGFVTELRRILRGTTP